MSCVAATNEKARVDPESSSFEGTWSLKSKHAGCEGQQTDDVGGPKWWRWRVFAECSAEAHAKGTGCTSSEAEGTCAEMRNLYVAMLYQAKEGNTSLTDMAFVLDDGYVVRGHRGLLSARSNYVRAVFLTDMQEARTGMLRVRDCTRASFYAFLEFMYTNTIEGSGEVQEADGCELWHLADLFDMCGLKRWLAKRITHTNVATVASHAVHVRDQGLLSACKKCVALGGCVLLRIPQCALVGVSAATARELMCGDARAIRRFHFAAKWCRANAACATLRAYVMRDVDACSILTCELKGVFTRSRDEGVALVLALMKAFDTDVRVQEKGCRELQGVDVRSMPPHMADQVHRVVTCALGTHCGDQVLVHEALVTLRRLVRYGQGWTSGDGEGKNNAVDGNGSTVVDGYGVQHVVAGMRAHVHDAVVQRMACCVLTHVAYKSASSAAIAMEHGGGHAVIQAMSTHTADLCVQEYACAALMVMAYGSASRCDSLMQAGGGDAVVCAMTTFPYSARMQELGCGVLYVLTCGSHVRGQRVAHAGGMDAVLRAIKQHREKAYVVEEAKRALECMLRNACGTRLPHGLPAEVCEDVAGVEGMVVEKKTWDDNTEVMWLYDVAVGRRNT